jgi:hypothetical protein
VQRRAGAGPSRLHQRVDRRRGQLAEEPVLADAGRDGPFRVHVQVAQGQWRHRGDSVDLRAQCAQGPQQGGAGVLVAEHGRLDGHELPAPERLREVREGRDLQEPPDRGHLVGQGGEPLPPCLQDLPGALPWPGQPAGVQLGDRVEPEFQRGDHAEAAAAAPQRPEQLGVVPVVDPARPAVGGDELDGGDAVGRQPVAAGQPAEPAAQRVAGHADVG